MKLTKILLLPLLLLTGSCINDDPAQPDNTDKVKIVETLEPFSQAFWETWPEADDNRSTYVINSLDQLYAELGAGVGEESPQYLTVDYDRYTLLVQYHIMTSQIESRRYYFYRYKGNKDYIWQLCVGYVHRDHLVDGEIIVDRIAVVVDKLPDTARVQWAESIIEPR